MQTLVIYQARRAQLVAYRLGTGEVPGSNPGMGDNFSIKINKDDDGSSTGGQTGD